MRRLTSIVTFALIVVAAAATPASAVTKFYGATNTSAVVYPGTANMLDLGIDVNGDAVGDTLTFKSKKSDVIILFNAECAVEGGTGAWVNVDILVDGVAVPPSDGDNALCTGKGTAELAEWSSNAVNAIVKLDAGTHEVQVQVSGGGTQYRIDDTSLIVMVQKG